MAGATPSLLCMQLLLVMAVTAMVTATDAPEQPAPALFQRRASRLASMLAMDSFPPLGSLASLLPSSMTSSMQDPSSEQKKTRSAAEEQPTARQSPVLSFDSLPSLAALASLLPPGAQSAGGPSSSSSSVWSDSSARLALAEQRARAALKLVSAEARSALTESVQSLRAAAAQAPPASAAAASAAVDASANLIKLLDDVRQVARGTLEGARGPQALKAAQQCGEEGVSRAERAVRAAVDALGRCVSVASAAEQEAARRLTALVQEAERRAAEAAMGAALDACMNTTRVKAALDCLTRQVLSARADVAGRAEAGVRGARALSGDAMYAERSALACVQRQAEVARVQATAFASWLQGCAAAAQASADLLPPPPTPPSSTTPDRQRMSPTASLPPAN